MLDGVDFIVAPDEAVGIVGPNGAGKTTLLSVLSGAQRARRQAASRCRGADVTPLDSCRALPSRADPNAPDTAAIQRHDGV